MSAPTHTTHHRQSDLDVDMWRFRGLHLYHIHITGKLSLKAQHTSRIVLRSASFEPDNLFAASSRAFLIRESILHASLEHPIDAVALFGHQR
jgi:hypothetical protein